MTKSKDASVGEYSIYFGWGAVVLGLVMLGFQLANKGGMPVVSIGIAVVGVLLVITGYLRRIAAK